MSVQTRIDGVAVPMEEKNLPAFSFAIGNPFEPGSIKGSRSTTWKIPATNQARALLGAEAMSEHVENGSRELVLGNYGQVYLKSRIRVTEWDREEIRAVVVGNNASWITEMRSKKIQEMDLGDTGEINAALIIASWFDEELMHIFPIINYGYDFTTATGLGIDAVRPGVRCHRIITQAFDEIGYSVKVTGGLNGVWKKFFLPATRNAVLSEDYLEGESLTLEGPPTVVNEITVIDSVPPWTPVVPFPPNAQVVSDPGGNNTNTFFYTTPLLMNLRVRIHLKIETIDVFNYSNAHYIYAYRTDTGEAIGPPVQVTLTANETQTFGLVLAEITIAAGTEVGVTMASIDPASAYVVHECRVVYEVFDVPYQEGVSVDLAKSAPRLNVLDLIKSIALLKNIAIDTNDQLKQVTFSYVDDKYKPVSAGLSLVGREDHSDPPIKGAELLPRRVLFKWKEDEDDGPLTEINTSIGERGFGGYIHDVEGGVLDDKEINLPFAATKMKMYPGSVFVPVIREDEAVNDPRYEWQPRILIHDGTARGEWTLQGEAQQVYPRCYFISFEGKQHGLSFYPETVNGDTGPGAFELRWSRFFHRFGNSKTLEIDLMLYDDELIHLDFGRPVQVHDGKTAGWYYFTEIKQKRFGVDEPTRCTLIQV